MQKSSFFKNFKYKNWFIFGLILILLISNILSFKTSSVKAEENKYIYAGGNAVGVYLNTKGAMLMGSNSVITKEGLIDVLKDSDLQVGDLILSVNNEEICDIEDITDAINKEGYNGEEIEIEYQRKNKTHSTKIIPAKDVQSGKYKLGIWVKNDTTGIGTLTFVLPNNRFGALGHKITDNSKSNYAIQDGKIYSSNILSVQKGQKGRPGELKGLFLQGKNNEGSIDKNISTGVYGNLNENSELLESAKTRRYEIGGKNTARPGKAKILSCIDGKEVKEYDIEIIKANYQNTSKEKSMVVKITDKTLLEKTGGIVQGMSGSPIIQNGKLIGAITHVFINDPTKGYGIYLDWMINN